MAVPGYTTKGSFSLDSSHLHFPKHPGGQAKSSEQDWEHFGLSSYMSSQACYASEQVSGRQNWGAHGATYK